MFVCLLTTIPGHMECSDQLYAYYESDLLNISIIKIVNNEKLYNKQYKF